MTLAIAAASFDAPSETFIRAHVRILAPGATILLCEDDGGATARAYPTLTHMNANARARSLRGGVAQTIRSHWRRYVDPALDADDEAPVLAFLEAHRPMALLAEYGPMGVRLRRACRRAGVPLFVHFHGFDATELTPSRRRHYRQLFADAAGVIAPSRFLAERLALLGCPASKLHVSPNGIDPQAFDSTRREPGRVLAVGRFVEKKAPHLTLSAFAQAKARFPAARLDMVGDGPLLERCRRTAEELGVNAAVTFHGAQPPEVIRVLLARASIFAQHSLTSKTGDTESFGISLIEAMASEVPVVATRHNGFPDTVEDGRTGRLVAEHDVAGMAEVLVELLEDPETAAAMGKAGRTRVLNRFTHEQVRERMRRIMGLDAAPADERETDGQARRRCPRP